MIQGIRKVLTQSRPSGTSAVSILTGEKYTTIDKIIVCNVTGSSSVSFSLYLDDNGTTYNETTALWFNQDLSYPGTFEWYSDTQEAAIVLNNPNANMAIQTNTADGIAVTVFGTERKV